MRSSPSVAHSVHHPRTQNGKKRPLQNRGKSPANRNNSTRDVHESDSTRKNVTRLFLLLIRLFFFKKRSKVRLASKSYLISVLTRFDSKSLFNSWTSPYFRLGDRCCQLHFWNLVSVFFSRMTPSLRPRARHHRVCVFILSHFDAGIDGASLARSFSEICVQTDVVVPPTVDSRFSEHHALCSLYPEVHYSESGILFKNPILQNTKCSRY